MINEKLLSYWQALEYLFFPNPCLACNRLKNIGGAELCDTCMSLLACEKVLEIQKKKVLFSSGLKQVYSLYTLENNNIAQKLVYALKFYGKKNIGRWAGEQLGESIDSTINYIIPIPLHPERVKKRGYDQNHIIAKSIHEKTQIPLKDDVMLRIKNTHEQTHLSRSARMQNLAHAFLLKENHQLEGKHVLLVDDVFTSGATLIHCLQPLKSIAMLSISFACICISNNFGNIINSTLNQPGNKPFQIKDGHSG